MKKNLFVLLFMPIVMSAQNFSYDNYENQEGVNAFSFSKKMLDAIDITTYNEDGTQQHITGDLHRVKFLNFNEDASEKSYKNLEMFFKTSKYKKVNMENEEAEGVEIYIKKKGTKISEVHLLLSDLGKGSLISLYGNLKANELCAISNALQLNACKHLKNINE